MRELVHSEVRVILLVHTVCSCDASHTGNLSNHHQCTRHWVCVSASADCAYQRCTAKTCCCLHPESVSHSSPDWQRLACLSLCVYTSESLQCNTNMHKMLACLYDCMKAVQSVPAWRNIPWCWSRYATVKPVCSTG